MKIAFEQSKTCGPEARKFIVIFDMENFSMKQYAYRPAAELVINIFQMYSLNYPEILKYCYIINGELFKAICLQIPGFNEYLHLQLSQIPKAQRTTEVKNLPIKF